MVHPRFLCYIQRGVAPRHLLRLGSGESDLRRNSAATGQSSSGSEEFFSKQGRVNWSLARRLQLLKAVSKLGMSLGLLATSLHLFIVSFMGLHVAGILGDVGSSCETAEYFYLEQILSRIDAFHSDVRKKSVSAEEAAESKIDIEQIFPFNKYFSDTPKPIFCGDWSLDLESAEGCFNHVRGIFKELSEYRYISWVILKIIAGVLSHPLL